MELTVLCLFLRSTTPMYWTKDHDLLLVIEVQTIDPYSQAIKRGSLKVPPAPLAIVE